MTSAAPKIATRFDEDDALEVRAAGGQHGLGVVTLVARRAGEVIHRFSGIIGPEIRQHSLQVGPGRHISETDFIGYLSHACEPNCRLDMARFELVALGDLAEGALLTIDYAATEDRLYRQFPCHCGAPACRRWITGRAEQPGQLGRTYLANRADPA
jgi:SET domain-containing protein